MKTVVLEEIRRLVACSNGLKNAYILIRRAFPNMSEHELNVVDEIVANKYN